MASNKRPRTRREDSDFIYFNVRCRPFCNFLDSAAATNVRGFRSESRSKGSRPLCPVPTRRDLTRLLGAPRSAISGPHSTHVYPDAH